MKGLCVALLVFLGHQALANQKRNQQHPKLNSVSVENLDANLGGNKFTLNPWLSVTKPSGPLKPNESRLGKAVPLAHQDLANQKRKQQHSLLNSVPVENLKDQVEIGGETISRKIRQRSDCGGVYDSSSGTIRHPLSGGNYQNHEYCIWIIRASEPFTITFDSFDTESSYDFLQVWDGSNVLGNFNGVGVPSPVQTTTNTAYLLFTSDFSVTRTGFELHWESLGSDCGGDYVSSSGTIRYPLTGGNYQNNENCIWIIRASVPITITFDSFDTESSYDYLQVGDGESIGSNVLGDFNGVGVPNPVQTTTNTAYLHFTSDYSVTRNGFELHWEPLGFGICAGGAIIGNQCLTFSEEQLNWDDAGAACARNSGQLATLVDHPDEVLANIVSNYGFGVAFWAGGSDIANEGSWVWKTGEPFSNNFPWGEGEPNSWQGTDEDCLSVNWGGVYNDQSCATELRYICEKGP